MTDRLTDDDLRAIRARVEAWRKNQSLWGPVETELTRDIMVNLDIPALLAHADALAAENARLREALGDIIEGASKYDYGEKGGYPYCALCDETYGAHAPDCPIAAARRALEGGE